MTSHLTASRRSASTRTRLSSLGYPAARRGASRRTSPACESRAYARPRGDGFYLCSARRLAEMTGPAARHPADHAPDRAAHDHGVDDSPRRIHVMLAMHRRRRHQRQCGFARCRRARDRARRRGRNLDRVRAIPLRAHCSSFHALLAHEPTASGHEPSAIASSPDGGQCIGPGHVTTAAAKIGPNRNELELPFKWARP